MPLSSKIHHLSELKSVLSDNKRAVDSVTGFIDRFNVEHICKPFESLKVKGYRVYDTLISLIVIQIMGLKVGGFKSSTHQNLTQAQKDCFYRLKNRSDIDWRGILLVFATKFIKLTSKIDTPEDCPKSKCFIFDDTLFQKRGKTIEFIGKVFDHVTKCYPLGFKALVLCFWDGKSLLPLDFSLHREKGNNAKRPYGMSASELREQFSKKRNRNSSQYKRVKELDESKIDTAIAQIKRAVRKGFTASYVLCDTWFVSEGLIRQVRSIQSGAMHLIGMCRMDKRRYTYLGKEYTAAELLKKYKAKNTKRCRNIRTQYIDFVVDYKGIRVKLFFSRYHNCSNWCLLLTTDLTLSYIQALETYQIRWAIEVFFKESKQHLGLGKCQSTDFDAQIADASICMITYLILNLQKRTNSYETFGGLFHESQRHLLELTLWERFWILLVEILSQISDILVIDIENLLSRVCTDNQTEDAIVRLLTLFEKPQPTTV
jgi:hypothetical protein